MHVRNEQRALHRLEFDIEWRPGHVACYLVDGREPVLVDAATPDRETEFRQQLDTYGYDPGDIDHVLVTHPHVDHIGLVSTVLAAGDSNPTVYAPAGVRERSALDRLDSLDVDRVYPGHGPVHDDLAGAIRRGRRSLEDRLDGVEALVRDGRSTAPEIASALAGSHEIEYLIPEAMSALAHLETHGTITSELTDGVRYYHA